MERRITANAQLAAIPGLNRQYPKTKHRVSCPGNDKTMSYDTEKHISMLGEHIGTANKQLGVPVFSFNYKNNKTVLYQDGNNPVACEIHNGRIVSINTVQDRREHPRVKPLWDSYVYLKYAGGGINAEILDISIKGIAIKVARLPPGIHEGSQVTVCAALRPKVSQKVFTVLSGEIYAMSPEKHRMVVMLNGSASEESIKNLSDYIESQLALTSVLAALDNTIWPEPMAETVTRPQECSLCPRLAECR